MRRDPGNELTKQQLVSIKFRISFMNFIVVGDRRVISTPNSWPVP